MDIQPRESKCGSRVGTMEDDSSLQIYQRPRRGRRIGLTLFVPVGRKEPMGERYHLGGGFQLNIKCFFVCCLFFCFCFFSENQNGTEMEEATRNFRRGRSSFCQREFFVRWEVRTEDLPGTFQL